MTPQGVSLRVRVVPRASRTQVVGEHAGALKVSLAAPPVDSKSKTVHMHGLDLSTVERVLTLATAGTSKT